MGKSRNAICSFSCSILVSASRGGQDGLMWKTHGGGGFTRLAHSLLQEPVTQLQFLILAPALVCDSHNEVALKSFCLFFL